MGEKQLTVSEVLVHSSVGGDLLTLHTLSNDSLGVSHNHPTTTRKLTDLRP
jgi:hypothetical protein